jgi:hypothetical protein
MFRIGQGGQVVDATGEGVRLRPLTDTLSDALRWERATVYGSSFRRSAVLDPWSCRVDRGGTAG